MVNLRTHTEFHFDYADRGYGKLSDVVKRIGVLGQSSAAITDSTTFGHISWYNECVKAKIKPILGAEVKIPIEDGEARMTLLARDNEGLEELYGLTSLAASAEIETSHILASSPHVVKLLGTLPLTSKDVKHPTLRKAYFADISPSTPPDLRDAKLRSGFLPVAVSENRYPALEDRPAFSLFGGAVEAYPQHLLTEREARVYLKGLPDEAFTLSDRIAEGCEVTLPTATNMKVSGDLEAVCRANIRKRLGKRWNKEYEARLELELRMIGEKKFESYFLIISDMVEYAKKHMMVGPARGSAAGSLVCYLANITDIDPLQHGLLFERFIDVTRADLPDIDLDFPDTKREMVISYLQEKYGAHNVVHLGTTLTLQPKSILRLVSKKLEIKMWEFQPLLDSMIERSSGDSRAAMCLLDTLEGMDSGKAIMARFPQVRIATAFEGHANATGTHAAGIIVCSQPVSKYCTVDSRSSTAQLDKSDAEKINLLKIDILGLRTLSVIEYVQEQLPKRIDMTRVPLDDEGAFKLLNDGRWAGIFQFEGDAVQMLTKQMRIDKFSDIVALGALARPGPLNSGGASEWAERRMGRSPVTHLHPLAQEFTEETYGIVIYQEQVMSIGRKIGRLDWDDVTELRKAMSKSKGEEFFNTYYDKFLKGAWAQKMSAEQARHVWDHLNTMGSWCLAGDTLLRNPFPNQVTPKTIRLADLAQNDGYIRPKLKGYDIVKRQQLYSLDAKVIKPTRCESAFCSGRAKTFQLRVDSGETIRATAPHQFYTKKGWVALCDLKNGDEVAMMGEKAPTFRKIKKGIGRGGQNWWPQAKAGAPLLKRNIKALRDKYTICQRCKAAPYQETHHQNNNHNDHRMENLLPVCRKCHKILHGGASAPHSVGKQIRWAQVLSIGKPKIELVYDVQMPLNRQNFEANGFIVHNSFNKSHAVSYGMISYWCAYLKSHYPLEFAAATLRHTKGEDQTINLLRELHEEGIDYLAFDPQQSRENWEVIRGRLIGGFLNLKGVGETTARELVAARGKWTEKQKAKVESAEVLYSDVFPARSRFAKLYAAPRANGFPGVTKLWTAKELDSAKNADGLPDEFYFLGRLSDKVPRDLNEYVFQVKRVQEGRPKLLTHDTAYLNLVMEDDTGRVYATVNNRMYEDVGKPIINTGVVGRSWYVMRGRLNKIRRINITWSKDITEMKL